MIKDHRDFMVNQTFVQGWKTGAEIGLGSGYLFVRWFSNPDLKMIGVDLGVRPDRVAKQKQIAAMFPDRATLINKSSVEASAMVKHGSLDFVFIDAGHGYHSVLADIRAWKPKVKKGGWIMGHDYHPSHPGVMIAVQESFKPTILPFHIWQVQL